MASRSDRNPALFLAWAGLCLSGCASAPARDSFHADWGPVDPRPTEKKAPLPSGRRSDASIRTDALQILASDPDLDPFEYRIRVKHGRIAIQETGSDPNPGQSQRARSLMARIPGASAAEIEPLEVDQEAPDGPEAFNPGDAPELVDERLRRHIIDRLTASQEVQMLESRVEVRSRRAVISGRAMSLKSKWEAERLAKDTPGIRKVSNQIRVLIGRKKKDSHFRREIQSLLTATHPYFDSRSVQAESRSGKVVLKGRVLSRREKHDIFDTISEIPGVTEIQDQLVTLQKS